MKSKKFGIFLVIFGLCLLGLSYYIKMQIAEGKMQISSAESKVETGKKLFSVTPYTKTVGDLATSSADKKIAAGKEEVALYQKRANWILVVGSVSVIAGIGMLILYRTRLKS